MHIAPAAFAAAVLVVALALPPPLPLPLVAVPSVAPGSICILSQNMCPT